MKKITIATAAAATAVAALEALLGLKTPLLCKGAEAAALEAAGYNRLEKGGWLWLGPSHPRDTSQEEVTAWPEGRAEIVVFAREGGDLERRALHAIQRVTLLG